MSSFYQTPITGTLVSPGAIARIIHNVSELPSKTKVALVLTIRELQIGQKDLFCHEEDEA